MQLLLAVKEGSVILGRINHQIADGLKKRLGKEEFVDISDYLDERLVAFLDVENQRQALVSLVDLLEQEGKIHNKEAFFDAILHREKIVSTGIGIGVAIPHAKLSGYDNFFVAIGIQKGEGIEWNALDGLPVRIIFMIGGPDDRQTEYLNILSMFTSAIKDENRRKRLLEANSPQDVLAVFEDV